ncbi:MAG: branched-chain amino acid ABC transporter permease [Burkholderiales bacterium]
MLYREAGQFKSTYAEDQRIFPIVQDRIAIAALLAIAFVVVPVFASEYWLKAILIPFLIFSLAALGLNILTGYAGQLSLGTAAFMAVGAFAAYNFELRLAWMPTLGGFFLGGLCAAAVGIVFGLPSLRIKGFYLAVATLACQFFVVWALNKFGWFSNYSSSGVITAQKIVILGYDFSKPHRFLGVSLIPEASTYLLVLALVALLALAAKNLVRSSVGRAWMAVRDMDVAAAVVGIPIMKTKLLAFAVSSFYCGVAGALFAYAYLGTVEPEAFTLDLSFRILFMIIIGGVGSVLGAFLGAAFITLFPIFLNTYAEPFARAIHVELPPGMTSNLELIIFGSLIVFFLVVEPLGFARLWQIAKEKLRLWPFPH